MIISRTPLRVSLFGGGSDLPAHSRVHGGAVLSFTIDHSVYVTVSRKFDDAIRVSYSRTEEVESVDEIQHPLVREALRMLGIPGGVEITSVADIPAKGTGLGSSSSFTVGLLNALHAYAGRHAPAEDLGRQACEIEIERCGEPIGKQDQYAAAYGGLNFIRFLPDDTVVAEKVLCQASTREALFDHLLFFYTGVTRSASGVLAEQARNLARRDKAEGMNRMVALAGEACRDLRENRIDGFGEALDEAWRLKREMASGISNPAIDEIYEAARAAGAQGGKLLGAGGGGFFLFFAAPERHDAIRARLSPLREVTFRLDPQGSRIIFVHE